MTKGRWIFRFGVWEEWELWVFPEEGEGGFGHFAVCGG